MNVKVWGWKAATARTSSRERGEVEFKIAYNRTILALVVTLEIKAWGASDESFELKELKVLVVLQVASSWSSIHWLHPNKICLEMMML